MHFRHVGGGLNPPYSDPKKNIYIYYMTTPGAVGRKVDVFLSLFVSFWSDKKSAPFLSPKPKQRILNGKFLNAFTSFKQKFGERLLNEKKVYMSFKRLLAQKKCFSCLLALNFGGRVYVF